MVRIISPSSFFLSVLGFVSVNFRDAVLLLGDCADPVVPGASPSYGDSLQFKGLGARVGSLPVLASRTQKITTNGFGVPLGLL